MFQLFRNKKLPGSPTLSFQMNATMEKISEIQNNSNREIYCLGHSDISLYSSSPTNKNSNINHDKPPELHELNNLNYFSESCENKELSSILKLSLPSSANTAGLREEESEEDKENQMDISTVPIIIESAINDDSFAEFDDYQLMNKNPCEHLDTRQIYIEREDEEADSGFSHEIHSSNKNELKHLKARNTSTFSKHGISPDDEETPVLQTKFLRPSLIGISAIRLRPHKRVSDTCADMRIEDSDEETDSNMENRERSDLVLTGQQ